MTQDVNVRFPGIDKKLELLIDRIEKLTEAVLATHTPEVQAEPDATINNINWLAEHDVHLFIGVNREAGQHYVRVMPVSGIPARTLNGPIDRSLSRLRRETERLLGGRR